MGCIPCQKIPKKHELHIQKTTGRIIHVKSEEIDAQKPNLDDYITIRLLGTGKSSEVLLSLYRPANEYRALKIIKKSFMSSCCSTEFMILQNLDHPNILKSFEMLEDSSSYYISSLYCEGGNLSKKLKTIKYFHENELAKIMQQVFSALIYFHENRIIHRDLKLENILLEKSEGYSLRIADFGLAYFVDSQMPDEICGTPLYMAPEIGIGAYDEKVDLWSAGVVLFVLATGHFPFRYRKTGGHSRPDYNSMDISPERFSGRSKELLDLVGNLLEIDPKKRISANEALEDPWIKFYSEI